MYINGKIVFGSLILLLILCKAGVYAQEPDSSEAPITLAPPDFSGLAWVDADTFLAVHDAKTPFEAHLPRISLLTLPESKGGLRWKTLDVSWPDSLAPASDLESITRVPNTPYFVLTESGDRGYYRRLFLGKYKAGRFSINDTVQWPVQVQNVEGTAIARAGKQLVYLYAERAQGMDSTLIRWMPLTITPFSVGPPEGFVAFYPDVPIDSTFRPVSDMVVDSTGVLYISSAYDPGRDDGPYSSRIWKAGIVTPGTESSVRVMIPAHPEILAQMDGFKVEGLAIRRTTGGIDQLYMGTDDEWMGGILRVVPDRRLPDVIPEN